MLDRIPTGVWIFHAIWITVASIAAIVYLLGSNPNKYPFLQTVVFTLTLVALVVYTNFTRKMQQAMVKQTTVNILPVFVAHIGEIQKPGGGNHHFDVMELENIGNGVALNVRVDTIEITWQDPQVNGVWSEPRIRFDGVMSIKPSERIPLNHQSTIGAQGQSPGDRFDWMDKLLSRADFDYELRIRFSDVLGNRYVQTIHTGISGIWPDAVVDGSEVNRTPLKSIRDNPFRRSPLRFVRRRRGPVIDG